MSADGGSGAGNSGHWYYEDGMVFVGGRQPGKATAWREEQERQYPSWPQDPDRGTGRTTDLLHAAPPGAVFIWCNDRTQYPKSLARYIGRTDLTVVGPGWLENFYWKGHRFSTIVLDHNTTLSGKQRVEFEKAMSENRSVEVSLPNPAQILQENKNLKRKVAELTLRLENVFP